jgi:hypothetical protein
MRNSFRYAARLNLQRVGPPRKLPRGEGFEDRGDRRRRCCAHRNWRRRAIGAGTIIAGLGISVGTLATVLSVTATVLSLAAGALAKPPRLTSGISGQQLDWRADPASGEPYVIGDAMVGASIVHQASWGDKNKFLGIVGVLSVCTITGFDGLYADMTQVTFSGRNATGYFHDFMYLSTQLGAMPEGAALDMTAPGFVEHAGLVGGS